MCKASIAAIVFSLSACLSTLAAAEVYRCDQEGKTVYQQMPCATGTQKAIDGRAQRKTREEDERQQKKLDQQRAKEKV